MSDDRALPKGALGDPDDLPRLAYADWCDDDRRIIEPTEPRP